MDSKPALTPSSPFASPGAFAIPTHIKAQLRLAGVTAKALSEMDASFQRTKTMPIDGWDQWVDNVLNGLRYVSVKYLNAMYGDSP